MNPGCRKEDGINDVDGVSDHRILSDWTTGQFHSTACIRGSLLDESPTNSPVTAREQSRMLVEECNIDSRLDVVGRLIELLLLLLRLS